MSDEAVFYSGSPLAPPEPPDVFTFLLWTKTPTLPNTFGWPSSPALPDSYIWLPSGHNVKVPALGDGEWHDVVL